MSRQHDDPPVGLDGHRQPPSAFRIITTDWFAGEVTLWLFGIWVLLPITLTEHLDLLLILIPIATNAVGIPIVAQRVRSIKDLFARGIQVPGTITGVSVFKGRCEVKYTYTCENATYKGSNLVSVPGRVQRLKQGDQAWIVFMPDNPRHAHIRQLYL